MSITLDGTNGITTPDVTSTGLTADTTTLVVDDVNDRVGIGTSSPSSKLSVNAGAAGNLAYFTDGVNTDFYIKTSSLLATVGPNAGSTGLAFQTGGTERARIDSSGNLLVGTTSAPNGSQNAAALRGTTDACLLLSRNATASASQAVFYNPNGVVGSISTSGSSTSYVTSSDYRLKNTIAPMTGALARVQALKPCTYKWNADGSDGEGFIAHELAEVCPQAVTGEKDAVDADGKPVYQGIDTSFLVATLTAAIQEQQAIIEEQKTALEAQQQAIAGLTARVEALEANNV